METRNGSVPGTGALSGLLAEVRAHITAPDAEARGHDLLVRLAGVKPLATTVGTAQILALRVSDWALPVLGLDQEVASDELEEEREAPSGGVMWTSDAEAYLSEHCGAPRRTGRTRANERRASRSLKNAVERSVNAQGRDQVCLEDVMQTLRSLASTDKWLG